MEIKGILNTARTLKQGSTMHISKDSPEYMKAIGYIGLCEQDMMSIEVSENDEVKLASETGELVMKVKKMELQEGSFFMPLSYLANRLVSAETHGTGVPSFKDTKVIISKL
ncbi:MAG TPA: molybdopterin dinucleotide binding domain-containing protein [Nitrospinota bacterium]|nr:molybdopterin dinucleotide binding domain-containing protein [Nitrospinota bacterium]|tara:strand:+ start:64735 stop:65067 length:333 start_codon:yes stop_codon:yes gene_type:complete